VAGEGGGGKARTGARGGQRVSTHPLSRFVTLRAPLRAAPCRSWLLPLEARCVRVLFFCMYFVRVVSCRAPPSPLPSGGWKDCSDDHALSICWNRACSHSFHRPSGPRPSWFVVDVVTPLGRHSLKLFSIFSALHPPLATAGRRPLRPGAQPAVINQGQSLLCCASRPSCPCSSWFVARACQHRTTISVAH
jgi:hypothetical protein